MHELYAIIAVWWRYSLLWPAQCAPCRPWQDDIGARLQVDLYLTLAILHEVFQIEKDDISVDDLKYAYAQVKIGAAKKDTLYSFIFLVNSDENARGLVNDLYLIVPLGLDYFNHRVFNVLNAQELPLDPDFVPVLHPAHVQTLEVADRLDETHPERAVFALPFGKSWADLRVIHELNLDALIPVGASRAPITLPFEFVRRRSKVDQKITEDFSDQDDREGLALWQRLFQDFVLLEIVAQPSITSSFIHLIFQALLLFLLFFLRSPSFFSFSAERDQVSF